MKPQAAILLSQHENGTGATAQHAASRAEVTSGKPVWRTMRFFVTLTHSQRHHTTQAGSRARRHTSISVNRFFPNEEQWLLAYIVNMVAAMVLCCRV